MLAAIPHIPPAFSGRSLAIGSLSIDVGFIVVRRLPVFVNIHVFSLMLSSAIASKSCSLHLYLFLGVSDPI